MLSKKIIFVAIFGGVLIAVATGFIENPPDASIIGATHYGYPFPWRMIMTTLPSTMKLILSNLTGDVLVWAGLLYVLAFIIHSYREKSGRRVLNDGV